MSDPDSDRASPITPRRVRSGLLAVVGIGATAGLVVTVFSGGRQMLAGLAMLPIGTVLAALGLDAASWLGEAVVFRSLAGHAVTGDPERRGSIAREVLRMVPVYVGGGFPGLVTPFGFAAIPGWVYALTGEGLSLGEASAVVGARAVLTSAFFVVAGAVAVAVTPFSGSGALSMAAAGVAALLAILLILAWVITHPDALVGLLRRVLTARPAERLVGGERVDRAATVAKREVERFSTEMGALVRERPSALAWAIAGLLFSRLCLLAILPVIMHGLGWRGPWGIVVGIVVAVQALASASPTPGGTGTVEAALAAGLAQVAPVATAGAAALLWRGFTFYLELVAGWVFFTRQVAGDRRRSR